MFLKEVVDWFVSINRKGYMWQIVNRMGKKTQSDLSWAFHFFFFYQTYRFVDRWLGQQICICQLGGPPLFVGLAKCVGWQPHKLFSHVCQMFDLRAKMFAQVNLLCVHRIGSNFLSCFPQEHLYFVASHAYKSINLYTKMRNACVRSYFLHLAIRNYLAAFSPHCKLLVNYAHVSEMG